MDIRLEPSPRARHGDRLQKIMVRGVQWGYVFLNNGHYYFGQEGGGHVFGEPDGKGRRCEIAIPETADDNQILGKARELIDAGKIIDPAVLNAWLEEHKRRTQESRANRPLFGRANKVADAATDNRPRDLLVKCLGMLGSDQPGVVFNAASKAEELRKELDATWDELIVKAIKLKRGK